MIFNSIAFLLFTAVFFLIWPAARTRASVRYLFLVAAAIVFYAWWNWRFVFLLFGTGVADFYVVRRMADRPRQARGWFAASLVLNVGTLALFKYAGPAARYLSAALALASVHIDLSDPLPPYLSVLPLGISFTTLQALTYTIDVYQGKLRPTRSLLHYLAFRSLFPLLLAGPIMRAADLLPQLATSRRPTAADRWEGLKLIVFGFFQKLVIANGLAPIVNEAFGAPAPASSGPYWWLVVTAYAFQVYCDFGGYSSIAAGLGKWMGYDLTLNFRHPYLATSLSEFWSRWHVSLTNWIWRYVFNPLSFRYLRLVERLRLPTVEQEMRLAYPAAALSALVLCGLWHGAGLTFLIWGAWHGLCLGLERLTNGPRRLRRLPGGRLLASLVTLAAVWIGWAIFRSGSLAQALFIVKRLFVPSGGLGAVHAQLDTAATVNLAFFLALGIGRELWERFGVSAWLRISPVARARLETAALALMIPACVLLRGPGHRFIYFQF